MRVSNRTDISDVTQQIAAALAVAEPVEPEANQTAILELLAKTIERLQADLSVVTSNPTQADTRLSIGATLIRVTTARETLFEKLLNRLFKNRVNLD